MYFLAGLVCIAVGVASFMHEGVARFIIMDNKIAGFLVHMFTQGTVSEGTFRMLRTACATIWIIFGLLLVLGGMAGG
tara:strand:+ start:24 stop:254 length:231 start_codon:yes stop_codon:yes gene_type:complete